MSEGSVLERYFVEGRSGINPWLCSFVCLFLTLPFFPDHAFLLHMDTKIIRKVNTLREHSSLKAAEPRFCGGLEPGLTTAICTVCLGG